MRQIVARARGEFIVLLNNDTIVTDNWLTQLVALANLSPAIGMVGPMSNYAAPPQLVDKVPYRLARRTGHKSPGNNSTSDVPVDLAALERFAHEWRQQHRAKWMEVERLGGFAS